MNILFLTVDSLRADRTSLFDHHRETTPFLATLADRSFEFRTAYVTGRNTAASFPGIHTATYQRYYDGIGIPHTGTPTIAERLRDGGYRTHAIHTNELLSREYNYDRGFDVYHDSRGDTDADRDDGTWRTKARDIIGDGVVFELIKRAHFLSTAHLGIKIFDTADSTSDFETELLQWTTEREAEWFVWAHFMNPHHPYEPPTECQEALGFDPVPTRTATKLSRKMRLRPEDVTTEERQTLRNLYDASVLSWDRELRSLYERLEASGELSETLIVVTADHGELLGEDGYYGHPPVLNQELLRVPLVVSGPVEPGTSTRPVSLLDLGPTLLTLADCQVPEEYLGHTLFNRDGTPTVDSTYPLIAETGDESNDLVCAIHENRKLVYDVESDTWTPYALTEAALHDRPIDAELPELREVIRDHLDRAEKNRQRGADIDEEALEEDLAALGYLNE